jgi:hypothetical protein
MYINKFNGIDKIRSKNTPMIQTESMDLDVDNNGNSSDIQDQEEEEEEKDGEDDIEALFEIPPSSSDEDYGEFGDATTTRKHKKSTRKTGHEIINVLRVQYILAILHLGCVWLRLPILIVDISR